MTLTLVETPILIPIRSGGHLDLRNPPIGGILITDIAAGLSNLCRFTGQSKFYSVAEHSVRVAEMVPWPLKLQALLHDGAEAYMGDVSTRLKHSPEMSGYRQLEQQLQRLILQKFCDTLYEAPEIKMADYAQGEIEYALLMEHPESSFSRCLDTWQPEQAYERFLLCYERFVGPEPRRVRKAS